MHREHLVILAVVQHVEVVIPELGANEQSLESADQQEEQGSEAVKQADLLVIDGG